MKVGFLVLARDKAKHVKACVESVFAQTYQGLDIWLSDQGSADGTREVLASLASAYDGPHKVHLLDCPLTDRRGMYGANQHLEWVHANTDSDIMLMTAADDLTHPDRTKRVVEVFEETNASFVGTCMQFTTPDGVVKGLTAHPGESRFISGREHLFKLVGSSSSTAWARDLVEKYDPFEGIYGSDVTLPFYATLERGFYYLHEQLHAYIEHIDPENMGLEGVMRAAEGDDKKIAQIQETALYQLTSTYSRMIQKHDELHPDRDGDEVKALWEKLMESSMKWVAQRDQLTLFRVPPIPLKS